MEAAGSFFGSHEVLSHHWCLNAAVCVLDTLLFAADGPLFGSLSHMLRLAALTQSRS
jgi:hypothetical protein